MVIRVFPIILLILEHRIEWFLLIFWVFSEKNNAENLARITHFICSNFYAGICYEV